MNACLSARPAKAQAGASQPNKMATCNKEAKAKNLAGDERKTLMKSCLSNSRSEDTGDIRVAEPEDADTDVAGWARMRSAAVIDPEAVAGTAFFEE
ncbi:MAG: PsiF family protein [Nitrospira sp.]|nr:PsiF family protein [Nitrospira sp.]